MRVVLSVSGKFHIFDLARELQRRQALEVVFTGYPRFKLRNEGLPIEKIRTWPWVQSAYMAMPNRQWLGKWLVREWEWLTRTTLDGYAAKNMPDCDVFVGLSSAALQSGRAARAKGAAYVCDRGSAHIRTQNDLLCEESERWGIPFDGIDPRVIAREEEEYAEADCITVPSSFSVRSFVDRGVPTSKVRLLPYGVNLGLFRQTSQPAPEGFDVLYVGGMNLNKGIPYLLQAFKRLRHEKKTLTFAGQPSAQFIKRMTALGLWSDDIRLLGHVPQTQLKDLMSCSHAMVLPSVQDGFGMVLSQAMACGCVVIGTTHTGAPDLIEDGKNGYVVPIRQSDAIAEKLQSLADSSHLRQLLSANALQSVQRAGGWHDYGDSAHRIYQTLRS